MFNLSINMFKGGKIKTGLILKVLNKKVNIDEIFNLLNRSYIL